MVFGFPSIRLQPPHKKAHIESPLLPSPLPLPRPARWCAQIASAVFKLASLSLPRATLMVPCAIIVPASAHLRISAYSRLILRRGRRPRRPAHVSSMSPAGRVPRSRARVTFGRSGPLIFLFLPPAAIFLSTAKEIWKRTPPKTHGLWNSFRPLAITAQKGPHRIACTSIPAAAPMHHTAALCSPNIKNPRPSGPHLHLPPLAASARFDNRLNGRPAHPPRRMRERQR